MKIKEKKSVRIYRRGEENDVPSRNEDAGIEKGNCENF
jgi:hypothetical protein